MINHRERFMKLALEDAYRGCAKGDGGPFGACIVREGKVIATGHNEVLGSKNPTRHAEICAITLASKRLGTHELSDCEIYSTTEPCAMCFPAIHWAKIKSVYFGTSIQDVKRLGFNEMTISNRTMKRLGRSPVELKPRICRDECVELLKFWKKLPGHRTY
jgi:guanine deaminase